MPAARTILLTGATGLLGRYLLRDLLASGRSVSVLVRDAPEAPAAERVAELVAFGSEALGRQLPLPFVLSGELRRPGLGLGPAERHRLATGCGTVIHAAASVHFQPSRDGEPWATNVDGTQHLLDLCRSMGIGELHHVSTAFVCGDRKGPVSEEDLDRGQRFHNAYEASKFEAERRVRRASGVHATIYRPSVIVGDSRTGYTCTYHGIYRFLHLAARLAEATRGGGVRPRRLPLRLPFSGEEPHNLVPVDWVARAIVDVLGRPRWHGRTYHLAGTDPVQSRVIKETAEKVLRLAGVEWAGAQELADPTHLERLFLDNLRDYWPYLRGDAIFACRNAGTALAHLPPPRVDGPMLARLIRFAELDQWGHAGARARPPGQPKPPGPQTEPDCAQYIEEFFTAHAPQSTLARTAVLDIMIGLDIRGAGGGQWSCRWARGELTGVRRGLDSRAEVTYRTDTATFAEVVRGAQTPQEAFFARRIEVSGDVEKALKLAVLFHQFLKEVPYRPRCLSEQRVTRGSGIGAACERRAG
jgi:thioester reductase-like protein